MRQLTQRIGRNPLKWLKATLFKLLGTTVNFPGAFVTDWVLAQAKLYAAQMTMPGLAAGFAAGLLLMLLIAFWAWRSQVGRWRRAISRAQHGAYRAAARRDEMEVFHALEVRRLERMAEHEAAERHRLLVQLSKIAIAEGAAAPDVIAVPEPVESIAEAPPITAHLPVDDIPDTLLEAPTIARAPLAPAQAAQATPNSPPLANVLANLHALDEEAPFATISDILAVINSEILSPAPTAENPSDLILQIIRPKPNEPTAST